MARKTAFYNLEIEMAVVRKTQSELANILGITPTTLSLKLNGTGTIEVSVKGKEYTTSQSKVSQQLNTTGSQEVWENPLVSDTVHAANLLDWIGDYMKADREYELQYRGEPRIDGNDIAFLENKYVSILLLRIYDHTLKFNGALSGTIKARRDMSNVADS